MICVKASDGDAAVGDQTGFMFDVTLDVPWNAPQAVVHLHSEGLWS